MESGLSSLSPAREDQKEKSRLQHGDKDGASPNTNDAAGRAILPPSPALGRVRKGSSQNCAAPRSLLPGPAYGASLDVPDMASRGHLARDYQSLSSSWQYINPAANGQRATPRYGALRTRALESGTKQAVALGGQDASPGSRDSPSSGRVHKGTTSRLGKPAQIFQYRDSRVHAHTPSSRVLFTKSSPPTKNRHEAMVDCFTPPAHSPVGWCCMPSHQRSIWPVVSQENGSPRVLGCSEPTRKVCSAIATCT